MALGFSLGGLLGGNDRQLAQTRYADQTSATETASAARRAGHRSSIPGAAAQGEKWEIKDREKWRWNR